MEHIMIIYLLNKRCIKLDFPKFLAWAARLYGGECKAPQATPNGVVEAGQHSSRPIEWEMSS